MVDVIKPEEVWSFMLVFRSDQCPFTVYPANYHGCGHPCYQNQADVPECNRRNCPGALVAMLDSK